MILKFGMQHLGLKLYKVNINGDPGLTLTNLISGEHLQDHWSSGFNLSNGMNIEIFVKNFPGTT